MKHLLKDFAQSLLSKSFHLTAISDLALELGWDINGIDSDGHTLAHYAANDGNVDLLRKLVSLGADINKGTGTCPLGIAIAAGHLSAVRVLLESGAAFNQDALHLAIFSMKEDYRLVEFLIDSGADVNAEENGGLSPLDCAALSGKLQVILLLITRGATHFHPLHLNATQVSIINHCREVVRQQALASPSCVIQIDHPVTYTPSKNSVFARHSTQVTNESALELQDRQRVHFSIEY